MSTSISEWGGEEVHVQRDDATGAWSIIAIHSTEPGPAVGGTRMRCYDSFDWAVEDALRLSRGMTMKTAAAGLPCGGAKAVIAVPEGLTAEDRRRLLLEHAARVNTFGGRFVTGPDMGTGEADMDLMGTVTEHLFCRSIGAGGSGTASPWTAMGVFHGVKASLRYVRGTDDLPGVRVLIQGVGEVGGRLAELLHAAGATLLLADVNTDLVERVAQRLPGSTIVAASDVYDTDCDVYAPCAMGATLNERTIPRLRCSIVAGAANNQLETEADADRLRARGILYAPDYVINAGGIIRGVGAETLGWSSDEIDHHVAAIGDTLTRIYHQAGARDEADAPSSSTKPAYGRRSLIAKTVGLAVGAVVGGGILRGAQPVAATHESEILYVDGIWTHFVSADGPGLSAGVSTEFGAVRGTNNGAGPGVQGESNGNEPGVVGRAYGPAATGVRGDGRYGVWGETAQAGFYGVMGRNASTTVGGAGVRGVNEGGDGVFGLAKQGGTGVSGESDSGWGVRGKSTTGNGVQGQGGPSRTGVVGDGSFGVLGRSSDAAGFGVWGQHFSTGPAVVGDSTNGYGGLFGGGKAQLRLVPKATGGKPTSGAHQKGEIYMDKNGALFVCTVAGTPGTWRKLSTTAS